MGVYGWQRMDVIAIYTVSNGPPHCWCVCVCASVYIQRAGAYSGVIATLQLHTLFCEGVDGGGEQRLISPLLLLDGSDIKTPCSRPIDLRASLSAAGKKPASQPPPRQRKPQESCNEKISSDLGRLLLLLLRRRRAANCWSAGSIARRHSPLFIAKAREREREMLDATPAASLHEVVPASSDKCAHPLSLIIWFLGA